MNERLLNVTNGRVAQARRVDRKHDPVTDKVLSALWEITIEPSLGDVTVALPATADCEAPLAVCTKDGRPLSAGCERDGGAGGADGDARRVPVGARPRGARSRGGVQRSGDADARGDARPCAHGHERRAGLGVAGGGRREAVAVPGPAAFERDGDGGDPGAERLRGDGCGVHRGRAHARERGAVGDRAARSGVRSTRRGRSRSRRRSTGRRWCWCTARGWTRRRCRRPRRSR